VPLIIDGYNVVFAETHRPLPKPPRELEQMHNDLLRRLEAWRTTTDEDFTAVFDGSEEGVRLARFQHFGRLEVIFSDPKSDADEEIKTYFRGYSGARVVGTAWLIDRMRRVSAAAPTRRRPPSPPAN
jgi:predicted RNA-binding protein with PIN domain